MTHMSAKRSKPPEGAGTPNTWSGDSPDTVCIIFTCSTESSVPQKKAKHENHDMQAPYVHPYTHPINTSLNIVTYLCSYNHLSPKINKTIIVSGIQISLGIVTVASMALEWEMWWVPCIGWAAFSIVGILLTLPLIIVIGIGAGAAQADWMSDKFIFTLCFVIPTILAVSANIVIAWFKRRRKESIRNGDGSGAKSGRVYVKRSSLSPRS